MDSSLGINKINPNSRIEYLDAVKGLGMLMIILGHSIQYGAINNWMHSFHVPLFFLVSGYFLKSKTESLDFFHKKWRQILKPLLFTHIICFLALGAVFLISSRQNPFNLRWFCGQLLFLKDYSLPVIWFLYALLWGQTMVHFILKYCEKYHLCITLLLFLASNSISDYVEVVPLCLLQGLSSSIFISLGYELKKRNLLTMEIPSSFFIASLLFALFAEMVPVYMSRNVYPLGVWNVITSSLLSITIILFFRNYLFDWLNGTSACHLLCHFGRFSLVILCFHCVEMSCQLEKITDIFGMPSYLYVVARFVILWMLPFIIVRMPILRKAFIDK